MMKTEQIIEDINKGIEGAKEILALGSIPRITRSFYEGSVQGLNKALDIIQNASKQKVMKPSEEICTRLENIEQALAGLEFLSSRSAKVPPKESVDLEECIKKVLLESSVKVNKEQCSELLKALEAFTDLTWLSGTALSEFNPFDDDPSDIFKDRYIKGDLYNKEIKLTQSKFLYTLSEISFQDLMNLLK